MSRDNPKSDKGAEGDPQTTAPKRDKAVDTNVSGRVKHDDRGNAVWEWSVTTGAFGGDAATQRMKKLDSTDLSLADDPTPGPGNPLGTVKGYSPYDSGVLAKKDAPRKKTDLRKLSEWLQLKKQAETKGSDED